MLKRFFTRGENETVFQLIYFYCICLLLVSLSNSIYLVSVAQIAMGINWIAEGSYREKFSRFSGNRPAIFMSSIYMVYLAGIFWTNDLVYGVGYDLKNKLPLLSLTFFLASSRPLSRFRLHALLLVFSASVLATSFIGMGVFVTNDYADPRELSPFVSHIYVGMMVVLVVFLLPWTLLRINANKKWLWLGLATSTWLLWYLFTLGSLTGFVCLVSVLVFLLLRQVVISTSTLRKIIAGSLLFSGLIATFLLLLYVVKPLAKRVTPTIASLSELTSFGNHYSHDFLNNQRENGHLVHFFVAEQELRVAWNERSQLCFDGFDLKGHELRETLLRYLSSKGLRKDLDGLNSLNNADMEAIENGVANYLYLQWPNVLIRLHQSFWELSEYARTGNPTGHSFSQRLELWRAALVAFRKHPVLGWGTGDVFEAIKSGLTEIKSPLENYRMKPHNQVLNLLLMVGLIGFVMVIGLLIAFIISSNATRHLPFNILLVIVTTASAGNNLIDFQIGLTFFLVFSIFFGLMFHDDKFTIPIPTYGLNE